MYKQNVGNNVCKLRNSVQQYMIFYTALFYTASLSSFLLQKFELYYLRKKSIKFSKKMLQKCSNNARCFCVTKRLKEGEHDVQKPTRFKVYCD